MLRWNIMKGNANPFVISETLGTYVNANNMISLIYQNLYEKEVTRESFLKEKNWVKFLFTK